MDSEFVRNFVVADDEEDGEASLLLEKRMDIIRADWRDPPAYVVSLVAKVIKSSELWANEIDDEFLIGHRGNQTGGPLTKDPEDNETLLAMRAVNDLLAPDYEIRLMLESIGSDTLYYYVLPPTAWAAIDIECGHIVGEKFMRLDFPSGGLHDFMRRIGLLVSN